MAAVIGTIVAAVLLVFCLWAQVGSMFRRRYHRRAPPTDECHTSSRINRIGRSLQGTIALRSHYLPDIVIRRKAGSGEYSSASSESMVHAPIVTSMSPSSSSTANLAVVRPTALVSCPSRSS